MQICLINLILDLRLTRNTDGQRFILKVLVLNFKETYTFPFIMPLGMATEKIAHTL